MAKQTSTPDSADATAPDAEALLLRAGLDTLTFGFAIFDRDLKLVASNRAFRTLRGYPAALCKPGTELVEFYRFNAERGDYGPGDAEAQAAIAPEPRPRAQAARARIRAGVRTDPQRPVHADRRWRPGAHLRRHHGAQARPSRTSRARKRSSRSRSTTCRARSPTPTTTSTSSSATTASPTCIRCRAELLQPGRPYPDVPALSGRARLLRRGRRRRAGRASAWKACAIRPGKTFEDRTPDGRVYEVYRRRAAPGGTVTVITDITGLKHAESELARKEAQLHVALDNMPGALVLHRRRRSTSSFCNDRFADMYPVPRELLQPGRPYPDLLRYLAEHGYYGDGDVEALVAQARREPAQSRRQDVRGPHAGRPRLPDRPPPRRRRAAR